MNYLHHPVVLRHALSCLLFAAGLYCCIPDANAGSVQFTYTTPSAGNTSAGVYASDDTLLRTLWSNEPTPAGSNTAIWNGLNDEGNPMAPGTYKIKILHSNITYTWEGVLGNTSTDTSGNTVTTGSTIRRSFKPTADLAISGSDMIFANGYNENKSLFDRSLTSQPNAVSYYGPDIESTRNFNHVAVDSSRFYMVQGGNGLNSAGFLAAFNTSNNTQYQFTSGTDETTGQVDWIKITDLAYADKYAPSLSAPGTLKDLTEDAVKTLSVAGRTDVVGLTGLEKAATGIAVQPGGNFLFASHGPAPRPTAYIQPTAYPNEIRVFNKTTGTLVSTYSNANLQQPGRMVSDNSGIWVIAKDSSLNPVVRRYTVNPTTGVLSPVAGSDITGLYAPVALALSPDFATLLVADSGTFATANNSQQVKAYTVSSGTPVSTWTLGLAGGYSAANGSTVANNKFHFFRPARIRSASPSASDVPGMVPSACLAFQSDGSFWVGDPGNERIQHFDASRNYVDNIMFLSSTYMATVCNGDNTRFFAGLLEFNINYSATDLQHSWTFVRNWAAGLTASEAAGAGALRPGFGTVVTLGGKVFGTSDKKIYELSTTGTTILRYNIPTSPDQVLHEDGSLRYATLSGSRATFYKRNFTGFSGSTPEWGTAAVLGTAPMPGTGPMTNSGGRGEMGYKHPTTTSGLLVFSDGNDSRFHLGAITPNGSTLSPFRWRTAPSGRYFDTHGTIGTYGDYPCNNAFTSGNHIILGAQGEGASDIVGRVYQANQFLHYWDNGLMVGQFGSPINYRYIEDYDANNGLPAGVNPGRAGNAFAVSTAAVGANLYVYHNDESQSSGIHRWKISNPNSVSVLAPPNAPATVTLPAGSNGIGLTGQYFTGVNFDTLSATGRVASVDFNWGAAAPVPELPADNFSIRYSGLIEPKYTENYTFTVDRGANDKVRLWINETLVADGWATTGTLTSSAVPLTAGTKARILLEYSETTGDSLVALKWQSSNQALQVIPYAQLNPSDERAFDYGVVDIHPTDNNATGRFEPAPQSLNGNGRSTTSAINTSLVPFDTPPQSVLKNARVTTFGFGLLDLEPYAQYRVRLHLAEISFNAAGARTFSATVPDAATIQSGTGAVAADLVAAPNIDIFALAGAKNKAVTVDYVVTTDNAGQLRLGSANGINYPSVNAIEISRDPEPLPKFAIIGNGTGLKGEYYDGDFATLVTTRLDSDVNFEWTSTNLPPVTGTTNNNYTVRWTGKIMTTKAGNYRFQVGVGDASHVKLTFAAINGGAPVINTWTTAASTQTTGDILLAGSTQYDVTLEYKQVTGASNVNLKWRIPSGTSVYTLIPRSQLFTTYTPPSSPVDLIVDNADPTGVTVLGTWGTGASSPKNGTNYLHDNATNKGTLQSVTYVPSLPEAGLYEVKTLWVGGASRANNVPYVIVHAGGTTTVNVDQTQVLTAGTWISLGSFNFNAGTAGSVSIQNTGTANGKYVMADAVRFVK